MFDYMTVDGKPVKMTEEQITFYEQWEREHPAPAPVTSVEDRVSDIELMMADLIGGAF